MKRILTTLCALAALVFLTAAGIKNGQQYQDGLGVRWDDSSGSTLWRLTITDEETTQLSPLTPGKRVNEDGGTLPRGDLIQGDELVGPDGEHYRVRKGKLQKRIIFKDGTTGWSSRKAITGGGGRM